MVVVVVVPVPMVLRHLVVWRIPGSWKREKERVGHWLIQSKVGGEGGQSLRHANKYVYIHTFKYNIPSVSLTHIHTYRHIYQFIYIYIYIHMYIYVYM
jgi:hypothetical protein